MSEKQISVYIGLGGNIENWAVLRPKIVDEFSKHKLIITKESSSYQTAAWGGVKQKDFTNEVWEISTCLAPQHLLNTLLSIEKKWGRDRKNEKKWGPRIIDLDILFYGHLCMANETLEIPHPRITERKFVLVPLNEIAPNFIHPQFNKSVRALLDICEDDTIVKKL